MLLRSLVITALALALSACNLSGTGEKGPFKTSSGVTLSKLDAQANPIASQTLNSSVYSNNGAYSFSNIRWSNWAQLQVSGQYFNEFTANTSADVITLDAITKKDRAFDTANVHIFSHLAAARIRQRVANGQNQLRAWRDTQTEMKQLFGLKKVSRNIHRGVEQLSLQKGSGRYRKDNANLLLFTGSFLAVGGDSVSLESLTTDFSDDGQFNGVGTSLFNSIAVAGGTDGLLENLSSNLSNYGIGNPPNNADMPTLPIWVNQDTTDDIAPVVTVNGSNPVIIVVGTPYVDEGASAIDNVDGVVTAIAVDGSDVIDTSEIGTHTVTYNATDIAGNTGSATRIVEVVEALDTEAPVIILLGDNPETLEVMTGEVISPYQDPGYTVTDNRDENITVNVSGTVDTSVLGTYILTYFAADIAGNDVTIDRTVEVVDTTDPVITLNGASVISVVAGTVYEDAGATATDNYYGDIDVEVLGVVDTDTVGTYTLTYTAEDGSHNLATETRTVTVTEAPDTTAPIITLLGDATVAVEAGTSYTDAGATALDDRDGDLTGAIAMGGSVNVNVPATYVLTYNVQDSVPNAAVEVTRTVIVEDTIAPEITLIGEPVISLVEGSSYTDAGATASDSLDGDITTNIAVGGDTVDTTTPDTYIITYNVMDNALHSAPEVTRTVTITEAPDTTEPVITLLGDATVTVEAGTSYTDAGATALDDRDGDLTGAIAVGGSVNVNVPATYILTYNVQDSALIPNAATEVTRTVVVSDTIAPTITLLGDAVLVIQKDASYSDAGATASDSLDGDITANISVDNPVNTSSPATYTVTYSVSDAEGNPATAVTRSVRVNAPPTANAGSDVSVETGNSVTLVGSGSDTDGAGTVTYQWKRGEWIISTSASYSYTPENSETLTFAVTDSDGTVTSDTVNIEVTLPASYQIVFVNDTTTIPRNLDANLFTQGLELMTSVVDGSGNPVDAEPTFDPSVVDLSTPDTYPMVFSYTDPYGRTITKTLTVIVENYAPLATSASVTVDEDSSNNSITLVASDANQGDTLTYTVNQPIHGTVVGTFPDVTYTPTPNFAGSDSFTFTVSDGIAQSTGTISITVTDIPEPNTAPVAIAQSVTVEEDSSDNAITLVGTDADVGDTLTYTTTPPTSGVLGGSEQNITYTPNQNFFGTDSFTFTVSDGIDSSTATVSITVTDIPEPNQVPVANARLATVDEDTADNLIVLSGLDPDGDNNALTYAISTQPLHGSLSGTAPNVTYTPNPNYAGTDEFYFTVNDGVDTSAPAKVLITVTDIIDVQEFAIAIGDVVSDGQPSTGAGNLETFGATDIYTFNVTAGQYVYFDIQDSGVFDFGYYTRYIVRDSAGTEIINSRLQAGDSNAVLTLGGDYTITVASSSGRVGTYQLQLLTVPPPQEFTIAIDDVISDGQPSAGAGNIEVPGSIDIYTFTATAGQNVYFDIQDSGVFDFGYNTRYIVRDSAGTEIINSRLQTGDSNVVLALGGEYTLTVDASGDRVGSYQFQLLTIPAPQEFTITIGDVVTDGQPSAGAGNIEVPGAIDIYTFTATAGQNVYFDIQDSGVFNFGYNTRYIVRDSAGTEIINSRLQAGDSSTVLTLGGEYTLTVDASGDRVGTYQFQLLTIPAPQEFSIAIGDVVTDGQPDIGAGNIEVPGAIDIYTFTATAGQEIGFDIQNHGAFDFGYNTRYIVKDSAGTEIVNSRLLSGDSSAVLTLGGEYTLTVDANGDRVGTYQFQLKAPYSLVFTNNPLHVIAGTTPDEFDDLLTNNTSAVAEFADSYIPVLAYDFNANDLLTEGSYPLTVTHTDAYGRVVSKDISIIVDSGVVSDYQILFSQNPLYVEVGSDIDDLYYIIDEEIAMVVDQNGDLVSDAFAMPNEDYWEGLGDLSTPDNHTLTYTYFDDFGREYTATLEVIVGATPANASPVIGTLFTINGTVGIPITIDNSTPTAYDTDGTIVSYSWTENGVEISTTPTFQYTPTTVGEHRLTLRVVDNDGAFTLGTKIVNVTEAPNALPTADAGRDKTVEVNNLIHLVGSGTDSDGTITSYNWTENGTSLATTAEFDYTPSTVGTHTLTLTVTDNRDGIATDTVIVEANAPNVAPTANAGGNQSVEVNTSITLSGLASSDSDGNITQYEWSENGTVLHTSDHYEFGYTPTTEGDHSITLTVTDDDGATATDTIVVTATEVVIVSATCRATPATEAAFTDTFINFESFDRPWPDNLNNVPLTVDDIASVFNSTRAFTDPFELQGKALVMPAQTVWDGYSDSQKALYLINSERCARGILPYEGISPTVELDVAQYYADYLSSNNVFGHNEDGSDPFGRLSQLAGVVTPGGGPNNADFFSYAENLASNSLGSTGSSPTVHEPVAKAIYAWMYDDKESTRVNIAEPPAENFIYTYGHRKFILATGLVENSGETNKEGLIGIGVSTAQETVDGYNWTKVYTVMNAFDPNENWPLGNIQTVDLLGSNICLDGYVPVVDSSPLVCEYQDVPGNSYFDNVEDYFSNELTPGGDLVLDFSEYYIGEHAAVEWSLVTYDHTAGPDYGHIERDENGQPVEGATVPLPDWLSINPTTGVITTDGAFGAPYGNIEWTGVVEVVGEDGFIYISGEITIHLVQHNPIFE